jgi:hypothetical protein
VDDEEYILSARSRTTNLDPSSIIDFYFMAQPKVSIFECSPISIADTDMTLSSRKDPTIANTLMGLVVDS